MGKKHAQPLRDQSAKVFLEAEARRRQVQVADRKRVEELEGQVQNLSQGVMGLVFEQARDRAVLMALVNEAARQGADFDALQEQVGLFLPGFLSGAAGLLRQGFGVPGVGVDAALELLRSRPNPLEEWRGARRDRN